MDFISDTLEGGVAQLLSARSSCADDASNGPRQDMQRQLREQVAAAKHGHRGLETALHLMCERLLDLENKWEEMQEVSNFWSACLAISDHLY